MRRTRYLAPALSAAAAALLTLLWIRGHTRTDTLSCKRGAPAREAPLPGDTHAYWSYTARNASLSSMPGAVGLSISVYISRRNDEESLKNWSSWPRWEYHTFPTPRTMLTPSHWRGPLDWRLGPLAFERGGRQGVEFRVVTLPVWLLVLAAAAPAIYSGSRAVRRRRRAARGQCAACGYDLRAAPLSTCPECGASSHPAGPDHPVPASARGAGA